MNLLYFLLRVYFRLYSFHFTKFYQNRMSKIKAYPYWVLAAITVLVLLGILINDRTNYIVIISATYYKTSAIYKPNTVVILLNGPDQIQFDRAIFCVIEGETEEETKYIPAKFRYAYEPIGICKWTAYIAECPAFEGFKRLYLTHIALRNQKIHIPHRLPYRPKRNVVEVANCFSPFFYNEHWQLVLTSLEIYRHFGSQLQIYYVQSMLESITNVLRKYQDLDFVKLEPWASFKLGQEAIEKIGFDPNLELDWRNQASAHTDCFLKYRDAAKFIVFGDVDDVLVPRLGKSYIDEFHSLSTAYPNAAGFTYNRYNTELQSNGHVERFSVSRSIRGAKVTNEWEDGKYVVNTSRIETAWLHYPGIYNKSSLSMFTIPAEKNIMIHLRNWTIARQLSDPVDGQWPTRNNLYKTQIHDLISNSSIMAIEKEFRYMMKLNYDVFQQLPTKNYYLPMIIACYDRIFYSKARHPDSCPGPLKCHIPAIKNLKCTVAVRKMVSSPIWRSIFYVSLDEGQFLSSDNGCYLG